jgi:hypothetical protein
LNTLFFTDPPTELEAPIICHHTWSLESQAAGTTLLEGDARFQEILRRMKLVGPFPRYIDDYDKFLERVESVDAKIRELPSDMGIDAFVKAAIKQDQDLKSGRLQTLFVDPKPGREEWERRRGHVYKMNPLAIYLANELAPQVLDAVASTGGGAAFGWYFERNVCEEFLISGGEGVEAVDLNRFSDTKLKASEETSETDLRPRKLLLADENNWESGYKALDQLLDKDDTVLRMPTSNFPIIDFATSNDEWHTSRIGSNTIKLDCTTGLKVLEKAGVIDGSWQTKTDKKSIVNNEGVDELLAKEQPEKPTITLYYVGYGSSAHYTVNLIGEKKVCDLFLKHVKLRRLRVKTATLTTKLEESIEPLLAGYGLLQSEDQESEVEEDVEMEETGQEEEEPAKADALTAKEVGGMNVAELKDALTDRNISTKGLKVTTSSLYLL